MLIPLLHTYKSAASRLGLTEWSLRMLVHRGRGPVAITIGRRVYFRDADLTAYVDSLAQLCSAPRAVQAPTTISAPERHRRGRRWSIAEQMGLAARKTS